MWPKPQHQCPIAQFEVQFRELQTPNDNKQEIVEQPTLTNQQENTKIQTQTEHPLEQDPPRKLRSARILKIPHR